MRWIKYRSFLFAGLFCLFSCDLPEEVYDNPLDLEYNAEKGITPPALIFTPKESTVNVGESVSVNIFAMEVDSIAGTFIQVIYDNTRLALTNLTLGDILKSNVNPIFFYNDDSNNGLINIYASFLGDEIAASGTGTLAFLTFTTLSPGTSTIRFGNDSEFVDRNDNQIILNGLGTGVVIAQ